MKTKMAGKSDKSAFITELKPKLITYHADNGKGTEKCFGWHT